MLQSGMTYETATDRLLMLSAHKQAVLLSSEGCVAIVYTGVRNGLPTVWVRKEQEGPPTNADWYERGLAFENGAVKVSAEDIE